MRIKNCFFVLLVFAMQFFSSCVREDSSDVNQDKIHASYELFYNANEDKSYARVTFRFSNTLGTQLELTSPSDVVFNGDVLTFQSALAYYEKQYAGYVQSGTFIWTDVNGTTYTNSIQNREIGYPLSLDTIPRNAAFEIFWSGDSLSANEKIHLYSNTVLVATQNNLNAKSVIIPLNVLQNAAQGNYVLWLDRLFEPSITEKTSAGGLIAGRYRPVNKTIYLD